VKYSPGDFLKVENIREHIGKYFIKNAFIKFPIYGCGNKFQNKNFM